MTVEPQDSSIQSRGERGTSVHGADMFTAVFGKTNGCLCSRKCKIISSLPIVQRIKIQDVRNLIWKNPGYVFYERFRNFFGRSAFLDPDSNGRLFFSKFTVKKLTLLTLARFLYFATFPSGGGGDPPGVWKLSVAELSGKKPASGLLLTSTRDW